MTTTPVSSLTDPYVVPKAKERKSDLDMEAFMRLLTVQLANQNPLEPMNDRDYFAQMAQLGQVQGMDQLNDQSKVQQAQSLMGKTVSAVRPNFVSDPSLSPIVTGVVTKLSISNGVYKIGLREANGGIVDVEMDSIQSVIPNENPADYASLIGKNVMGVSDSGGVVQGQVQVIENSNGILMAVVKGADGKNLTVPVKNLQNVGM